MAHALFSMHHVLVTYTLYACQIALIKAGAELAAMSACVHVGALQKVSPALFKIMQT